MTQFRLRTLLAAVAMLSVIGAFLKSGGSFELKANFRTDAYAYFCLDCGWDSFEMFRFMTYRDTTWTIDLLNRRIIGIAYCPEDRQRRKPLLIEYFP